MSVTSTEPASPQAARRVAEREGRAAPGIRALLLAVALIVIAAVLLVLSSSTSGAAKGALIVAAIVILVPTITAFGGLVQVVPGEARVIQLFGSYRGTVRDSGLRWVNPFTVKRKVSTRIRNHETPVSKVNDADGNPIEIAAVVVWQVQDTAMALYSVDDFAQFVAIQTETAVRHIASSYPYDTHGSGAPSLRDNADEITGQLSAEIGARVAPAGVTIVESRLTWLSYAPEIAQTMLRQQQASAVIGARARIVEGAVGMVKLALQRLEEDGVIELDEERKAAMVSNLLVVLCSEQSTQPVVNTGTLYQ